MADFLSQFVGKDETPSVEFKHHRGNRKVSDSTKIVKDAEGDRFYTERAYLADKEDIERIISESNPVLEYAGGGSGIMGRTITFTIKGRDDLNYIDVPITKATTLAELAELISPDNLPHPTEFVEDSTKKVKDAEGDDFEDEPEREFTDEEIIEWFKYGFDDGDDHHSLYIEAYRDKGYDESIWETMGQLDDIIVDQPASWLLDRVFYGDFNPRHTYWRFNGYGNLESFDGPFSSLFDEHIDETVIVEYIRDHMDEHREDIEAYFEDDED